MNMYLAFIIHDISGIRSKETEGSKQAACGSSNVHRCTDEAGSLAPPPPLAAAKRSDVDIQSPSWHDSSPLNFSSTTFPALDLITHLVQIHSIAVKYILSEKGRYIVWTSGLLLPCALCAAPATGTRRRMMRARWPFIQLQRSSRCVYCVCHLMKSINTLCDDRYSIKVKHATLYVVSHLHTSYRRGIKCTFFNELLHFCIDTVFAIQDQPNYQYGEFNFFEWSSVRNQE